MKSGKNKAKRRRLLVWAAILVGVLVLLFVVIVLWPPPVSNYEFLASNSPERIEHAYLPTPRGYSSVMGDVVLTEEVFVVEGDISDIVKAAEVELAKEGFTRMKFTMFGAYAVFHRPVASIIMVVEGRFAPTPADHQNCEPAEGVVTVFVQDVPEATYLDRIRWWLDRKGILREYFIN